MLRMFYFWRQMSCYCSRPAIAVVQAHLSLLEKRQMGRPCLSLEMQLKGKIRILKYPQKDLFPSQNYVLWNKKRKKHIWECLLSQRRHVVVGKLLFRNLSCCVIMILGPFPFPSISCTSTATCWLRTCTPCGDTLAPGWIAHDSVILTLFSSIWKFGTKHWQLLRIRCRTSVRECETVWSNQLQTGIQTVCELKHPTVSKLEQLEASQCQWSWI